MPADGPSAASDQGLTLSSVGELGAVAGLLTVTGWSLPLAWGWLLPAAVLGALFVVAEHRRRALTSVPLLERVVAQSAPARLALLAAAGCSGAVFVTVALRCFAGVLVAFPAAWWSLGVVVVFGVLTRRVKATRIRAPLMLLGVLAIVTSAVLGTRFEASGNDARGWAHSGPVHGIHPFQTTAIIVDGHGPYDLPINDYVEPDGHRGYGPEALADALERALHQIAEVHFTNGPARAKMAFAQAEVIHVVDPPIRERLDREPPDEDAPRLRVTSGTFGQGSSVEFVCPGRRDDPRGASPDNIMNRMCPDKYASEASAGLGVTGRWPGYAEARGNERVGLSRWLGWTRSDDDTGRALLDIEIRWVAWGSLLLVIVLAGIRREDTGTSVGVLAGVTMLCALVVGVVWLLVDGPNHLSIAATERGLADDAPWNTTAWVGAGAVFAGLAAARLSRPESENPTPKAPAAWGRVAFATVAVTTVAVGGHLSALRWIVPRRYGTLDGALPMQAFVEGLSEAIGERAGFSILEIESIVAAVVAVLLLTVAISVARSVGIAASVVWGSGPGPGNVTPTRRRALALLALAIVVVALTVSRKTQGASTLVGGAVGLTVILSSALHRLTRPPRSLVAATLHGFWVLVGGAAVLHATLSAPQPSHPFVLLCGAAGLLTAVAALSLLFLRAAPEPAPGAVPPGEDDDTSNARP